MIYLPFKYARSIRVKITYCKIDLFPFIGYGKGFYYLYF